MFTEDDGSDAAKENSFLVFTEGDGRGAAEGTL